ncbi:MAG: class I SAM-dependent methyltransferase [Thermodesulfovibrionales bacterium]
MDTKEYKVIQDKIYSYKRLDPIPENEELTSFYQSMYYDLIRKGGRAPELRRLMSGGEEGPRERQWLREGLYSDICNILNQYAAGKRILDIGCGNGEFISFLKESGFETFGIEPASEAAEVAKSRGLNVFNCSLEDFKKNHSSNVKGFDAITLLNVLEHVPDPANVIEICKSLLNSQGILCIRVPNDFTEIQSAAQKHINTTKSWWIAIPDHINYYNFESLRSFITYLGFGIIYSQGDFPMEFFLLMGDDYVDNLEVGGKCHQKRISFELGIPGNLRRRIFQALSTVGLGRNCLVFAKLINK